MAEDRWRHFATNLRLANERSGDLMTKRPPLALTKTHGAGLPGYQLVSNNKWSFPAIFTALNETLIE